MKNTFSLVGVLLLISASSQAKVLFSCESKFQFMAPGKTIHLKLSQKRAEAVRTYLVNKGVPSDKIDAAGFGETKPLADNTTAAGRAQNRRVEFIFSTN